MTEKCLQQRFAEALGGPVRLGDLDVIQMDRIPVTTATVTIRFLSVSCPGVHGVAIKSAKGAVKLSDGRCVGTVHTWDEPGLPRTVSYRVDCPDGELRVWNVYRTRHPTGEATEDAWTGNAGMVVDLATDQLRRYRCSAGPGPFDPEELRFELGWE